MRTGKDLYKVSAEIIGEHNLRRRQRSWDYDDLLCNAMNSHIRIKARPSQKHCSRVEMTVRLVESCKYFRSDNERWKPSCKVPYNLI